MNNNIIKSLRRTVLGTVAAAAVAIGFTACAEDTFTTQNTPSSANGYNYELIVPSDMGGGMTRAIAYNSETGGYDGTFETTDNIYVYNVTKDAYGSKKTEQGWWNDTFLHPDANGKTANLVGELAFGKYDYASGSHAEITPEVGDELYLYYKNYGQSFSYNKYKYSEVNLDFALAKVKIESINDGVIKTSKALFEHPHSIYKINFTGMGSGVKIKKVIISSEQQKLVNYYNPTNIKWPYTFAEVTYTYEGEGTDQHDLFYALRFVNNYNDNQSSPGDVITFRALGSDGHNYFGTKTVATDLENSKYYHADVPMTDMGLAMTLTNNTTGELVELYEWNSISAKEAAYTATNLGYNIGLEWGGGEKTLTFKNLTLRNNGNVIRVNTDLNDIENTKKHHLILDGLNTLCSIDNVDNFSINDNSSLNISGLSGGKLIIEKGGMYVFKNATMTIESGEIIVNSLLGISENASIKVEGGVLTTNVLEAWHETSSCIISKSGKLRISKNSYVREGLIKAADGYALMVNQDGDYLVYTVTEDDGSGRAKSIVVTPATTTLYYSSSLGYIGTTSLSAHVYPENTTNKSVTWKTSDPNVVYVNEEGWVESKGIGVATVTATTNDGTNLSAQCIVTVKPASGIRYKNEYINKTPTSEPFINPLTIEGSVTSVTYTSSDNSVATVNTSTGKVTIAAGAAVGQTVTITATATMAEDGEYSYPEWLRSSSYEISIESPAGEGQRDDYIHDSW